MSFLKFNEYLDGKGKDAEKKPIVDPAADTGPEGDSTPPKPVTKGKNWDTKAPKSTNGAKPYRAPGTPMKPKEEKGGFADKGSIPVYNPNMKLGGSKNIPGGTEVSGWKTKTESFLDATKGMSSSEFAQYMLKECGCGMPAEEADDLPFVTSYTTGKFHPHPPEAIKYVVVLANKNDRILENLLQELKKGGGLPKLMKALIDSHPESLSALSDLLDDDEGGERRAMSLVRAMNDGRMKFLDGQFDEAVGPPFGLEDEEMDHEDSEEMDGEDGEMGPPEEDDMEMDDMGGDMDGMDDEDGPPMAGNDPMMGAEDEEGEDEEDLPAPPPPPKKKRKRKRFGFQRMLDAMMGNDYMYKYMNM